MSVSLSTDFWARRARNATGITHFVVTGNGVVLRSETENRPRFDPMQGWVPSAETDPPLTPIGVIKEDPAADGYDSHPDDEYPYAIIGMDNNWSDYVLTVPPVPDPQNWPDDDYYKLQHDMFKTLRGSEDMLHDPALYAHVSQLSTHSFHARDVIVEPYPCDSAWTSINMPRMLDQTERELLLTVASRASRENYWHAFTVGAGRQGICLRTLDMDVGEHFYAPATLLRRATQNEVDEVRGANKVRALLARRKRMSRKKREEEMSLDSLLEA